MQFYKNGTIQKLKARSFQLRENYFCMLNIQRSKALPLLYSVNVYTLEIIHSCEWATWLRASLGHPSLSGADLSSFIPLFDFLVLHKMYFWNNLAMAA